MNAAAMMSEETNMELKMRGSDHDRDCCCCWAFGTALNRFI
jgi:hypothetical protein